MAPADYRFWELLNYVVQNEPVESLDPVTLGFFASIGIEKGKPFAPDARMKKILTEAAAVGDATVRTITYQSRIPEAFYYPNSTWRQWLGGYKFEKQPGVAYLDAAAFFYFYATGVTPAMEAKMVGQGSQYAVGLLDSQGNPLDGGKTYRLHVLPNAPAKDFWSAIVYDNQTRSMLQTDQDFPQVSSLDKGLVVNKDGSVDVYFGPEGPGRHGAQLDSDHPRQGLEHAVPAVRPAGALVRQDLETERDRAGDGGVSGATAAAGRRLNDLVRD